MSQNLLKIRKAKEEDALWMSGLTKTSLKTFWSEVSIKKAISASHSKGFVLINSSTQKKLGYSLVQGIGEEGELLILILEESARGQGHGRLLLSHTLKSLKKAGLKKIFLEVSEDNVSALQVYTALNFIKIGERPEYYLTQSGLKKALILRCDL